MNYPIVFDNFLNEDEINLLLNYSNSSQELYNSHISSCEYWNKRCIYFFSIRDKKVQEILIKKSLLMKNTIIENSNVQDKLYVEYPQFVKWEPGWELTPHCDNCEPDGITPNATPWRSHGGVIYLNDDFDGGEIFYPNLGLEIKPKKGMMVIHPAGLKYLHGVKKVVEGIRHTISVFFTYQPIENNFIVNELEKNTN